MFVFVFANLLVIPLFFMAHPHAGPIVHDFVRPGDPGRRQLDLGAADHRDRRHDGRALAAVLPAVEHHRQADHAALDQLRAARHLDRRVRGRARRRRADLRLRRSRFDGHPVLRPLHRRRRDRARAATTRSGSLAGAFFAIVLLNASLIGAGAVTLATQLRVRRRVRHQELAAPQLPRGQGLLRGVRALIAGGGRDRADPRRPAGRDHRGGAGAVRDRCCR